MNVAFLQQGAVRHPGAGVRSFRDPDPESGGSERFDVRWYANPPGIPPGAVLLLETVPERGAAVKNHVLRTTANSQGYVRSAIDVPAAANGAHVHVIADPDRRRALCYLA